MKNYYKVRAIRGAISVKANTRPAILAATKKLLKELIRQNRLTRPEIISAILSVTANLNAVPPALAARRMGWQRVPMLCLQEMALQGEKDRYVRVLLQVVKSDKMAVRHVYLGGARRLRPDLA